jgi:zinc/manganese transport system substrate-binding protein
MRTIPKPDDVFCGRRKLMASMAAAMLMMTSVSYGKSDGASAGAGEDGGRLQVIASISILADMVRQVGGDKVQVTPFVGADADAHTFEPAPTDAKALGQAQVLVINGMDFEFWLPRLLAASAFKGREVVATQGITPRRLMQDAHGHEHDQNEGHDHDHGDHGHKHEDGHGIHHADSHKHDHHHHGEFDPHAWQDLGNAVIYVRNIAQGLGAADPANQAYYAQRATDYETKIKTLDQTLKQAFKEVPKADRKVITQHDAFGYFAQAYGIELISAVGISSAAEPSAKEVAAIIAQAREHGIKGIFVENISNPRLVRQIAKESGARLGGTLYSDALAKAGHPADTYLGMMGWNAKQLLDVLKPAR